MSLILKMMSGDDAPDEDTRKPFELITGVVGVRFMKNGEHCAAHVTFDDTDPESFAPLLGNVYVMNENGKTISSFGVAPLPTQDDAEKDLERRVDEIDQRTSDIMGKLRAVFNEKFCAGPMEVLAAVDFAWSDRDRQLITRALRTAFDYKLSNGKKVADAFNEIYAIVRQAINLEVFQREVQPAAD